MVDTTDKRVIFKISENELKVYAYEIGLGNNRIIVETFYIPKDPAKLLAPITQAILAKTFA